MTCDLRNAERALPARVRKRIRTQWEHAGEMRKTEDPKSMIVPIVSRDLLAGEMRKAS